MVKVVINQELNGVELYFDGVPAQEILDKLHELSFRWHRKDKKWYAKQNPERMAFANSLDSNCPVNNASTHTTEAKSAEPYDLFALTRTDDIGDNYGTYRLYDTKEIAARVRKHLRERFPMCKFSVTSKIHSIHMEITSGPYDRESDMMKSIAEYAIKYLNSWNYDNSDSMTDYFDTNFYANGDVLSRYDYEQREATVSEANIAERFTEAKAAFDKAERERQERELAERIEQAKRDEEEAKIRRAENEKKAKSIEEHAVVSDADFWALDLVNKDECGASSLRLYEEAEQNQNRPRENAHVTRTVTLNDEDYANFCELLLHDFSFLSGMGGANTADYRVVCTEDYDRMTADERATVEMYGDAYVAIVNGGDIKFIVDPEGRAYAKYVYLIDDATTIYNSYQPSRGIPDAEAAAAVFDAEVLDNAFSVWFSARPECACADLCLPSNSGYLKELVDYLAEKKLPLNISAVRAMKDIMHKDIMYKALDYIKRADWQAGKSVLKPGDEITVIRIGSLGGVSRVAGYFDRFVPHEDGSVNVVFKPQNKRNLYELAFDNNYHGFVYRGFLDYPEDLLYDITTNERGWVTKTGKFLSFDEGQLAAIEKYMREYKHFPVINTYNPSI